MARPLAPAPAPALPPTLSLVLALILVLTLGHPSAAAAALSPSKRGLVFTPKDHPEDDALWTRPGSDIQWYYNYGPAPSPPLPPRHGLDFVPMQWGVDPANSTDTSFLDAVRPLARAGLISHAMSFNEPDMAHDASGGSGISPDDAARAWVANFEPLRAAGVKVGLPAVSAAAGGIPWLREFLDSCAAALGGGKNCTYDFQSVHFYGSFDGMKAYLAERSDAFPRAEIWVTEFGYPDQSLADTQTFYNSSVTLLDRLASVARYAYFGAFRSTESNVGPSAAFLSGDGSLTDIGSWYLGGGATGVTPEGGAAGRSVGDAGAAGAVLVVLGVWMVVAVGMWAGHVM